MTSLDASWREIVIDWSEQNVSSRRLEHVMGVEATCVELAQVHGYSKRKAAKAGLLHDLAKFFPGKKLLKIARKHGLEIDSICLQHPHLIHADVSAVVAKEKFGVKNKQILQAVANHTLGKPKMDILSCIVFVADAIEPGRGKTKQLERLRGIAKENLFEAVWKTSDYSLNYLISDRKIIHPRTILTRNWALLKAREEI